MVLCFQLLEDAVQVGIASTKASCKPVSAPFSNSFAVSDDLELPGLTGDPRGFNTQALSDEGRETRGFGSIVLSSWAVNDLDCHFFLLGLHEQADCHLPDYS